MMALLRVAVALLPLGLAPGWLLLIGEGILDLGGGEKDLLWVMPWTLWAVLFAGSSFWLWHRGWSLARATARSAWVGVAGIALAAAGLAAVGQLGVAGGLLGGKYSPRWAVDSLPCGDADRADGTSD